jgi:biofilm PGA synthesis N-glycosyltransferase PgaC
MTLFAILFWFLLFVIFYSYLGYGIFLYLIVKIKRLINPEIQNFDRTYEPSVTLLIAAYNEKDFIEDKILNCLALDYPKDKLKLIFVTDGSDDGTPELISKHTGITLLHEAARSGKISAVNRAMKVVDTEITIFCDANTILNKEAIRNIVRHFQFANVGCVAGEKRILNKEKEGASGAGEGIYWKYESLLKKLDSELKTVVGAAGELFALRTDLFKPTETNAIIEDFVISLRIAQQGYKVVYEPEAYAMETSSANVKEELKRKIRICAGGIQSVVWLSALLNPFKYGWLTFQYVSHRVLRWTITPLFLLLVIPMNIILAQYFGGIYTLLLAGQILFYVAALTGWYLQYREMKVKALYIPYYFFIMNYAVYLGFFRYIRGRQQVNWERSERAKI